MLRRVKFVLVRGLILQILLTFVAAVLCYYLDVNSFGIKVAAIISCGVVGLVLGIMTAANSESNIMNNVLFNNLLYTILLLGFIALYRLLGIKEIGDFSGEYVKGAVIIVSGLVGAIIYIIKQ